MRIDTLQDHRAAIEALAASKVGDDAGSAELLGQYVRIEAAAKIALRAATVRLGAAYSVAEVARMLGRLDEDESPRMDAWYSARPAVPRGLLADPSSGDFVLMSRAADELGVSRHAIAAMGHSGELPSVITPTGRILFEISGVKR